MGSSILLVFSCRVAGMPDFVAMSPPLFVKSSAIMLTKLFLFKFYFCMMMVLFVPSWNTLQIFHFILANKIFNFWIGPFKSIANYWATRQWDMLEFACITPSFQFYLHFNALRWSNLQFFLFEHLMQCRLLLLAQQNEIKNLLCAHFKCLST